MHRRTRLSCRIQENSGRLLDGIGWAAACWLGRAEQRSHTQTESPSEQGSNSDPMATRTDILFNCIWPYVCRHYALEALVLNQPSYELAQDTVEQCHLIGVLGLSLDPRESLTRLRPAQNEIGARMSAKFDDPFIAIKKCTSAGTQYLRARECKYV
jgi:hypothetical protein